ncbi:MAG: hypothetical protein IJY66_07395 [Clostridia bacterium]|nr:hypothetical protein [Clostridia bacterium]
MENLKKRFFKKSRGKTFVYKSFPPFKKLEKGKYFSQKGALFVVWAGFIQMAVYFLKSPVDFQRVVIYCLSPSPLQQNPFPPSLKFFWVGCGEGFFF